MSGEAFTRGNVDWPTIVQVLCDISRRSEEFLMDNALIGGAACAFYRVKLQKEAGQDFRPPQYTPDQECVWLSRGVDFIGQRLDEYGEALGIQPEGEPPRFYVGGVWIDSPEVGLSMKAKRCVRDAIVATVEVDGEKVSFSAADPITLYREKVALVRHRKDRPQDPLHAEVLREFLFLDLTKRLEQGHLSAAAAKQWRDDAKEIKEVDSSFHDDVRFRRRVHSALSRADMDTPKAVRAYVSHHIAPPPLVSGEAAVGEATQQREIESERLVEERLRERTSSSAPFSQTTIWLR